MSVDRENSKRYLGDSVYVELTGFGVKLMTWNSYPDDPRNEIVLEPEVLAQLVDYLFEQEIITKPE